MIGPDDLLDALAELLAPRVARLLPEPPVEPARSDERGLLTPAEVAHAARLHPQTVYRHLRDGRLRGERAGSRWRIPPDAVTEYLSTADPRATRAGIRVPARQPARRGPLRALLDAEQEAG